MPTFDLPPMTASRACLGSLRPATRFPCTDKVDNARCFGGSGCRPGFPGETCYTIREVWGEVGCNHSAGYPPCDPGPPQHQCRAVCTYINDNGFRTVCGTATVRGPGAPRTLCQTAQSYAKKACGSKKRGQRCSYQGS